MNSKQLVCILAVLVVASAGIFLIGLQADVPAIAAPVSNTDAGKVLGIHYYTLKQNVTPQQFERFIREEWSPLVRDLFPGLVMRVMKGERGAQVGKYVLVYEFSSLYVRNFYWPRPGENSDAANAIWDTCSEQVTPVWERFGELVERVEYTDYVDLVTI